MSRDTAAAEFAARLRMLKERSGLSYGVLAKRLHMSTSTLHRYCNGDAVPTDYAPVERLARLCRASREELVELHRRWVLADADRGRKGAPSGTASAGSGETGPGGPGAGAAPGHVGQDRFPYDPGVTGQWATEETPGPRGSAPGHDVTGQWSIPVAGGDLPDESGEFTTSALVEQWGGTPPATLPGGAPAPWATQAIGQPWGPGVPGVPQEGQGAEHAADAFGAEAPGA
ncbi:helix-turn-helix domain-containing protein, partial [Streptomyces sp. G35A]